jgi:hypothetical protein
MATLRAADVVASELLDLPRVKGGRNDRVNRLGRTIDAGFDHRVILRIGTSSDLNAGLAALSG